MPRPMTVMAALMIVAVPLQAQTLVIGRAEAPPVIDGRADDAVWQDAATASDFSVLGSGGTQLANRQSTVRAAWDDRALYLHALMIETDPAAITAEVAVRDGQVWMEDCVELFIQPDTDRGDYYHFIVNALGTVFDERNDNSGWDADVSVAAEIGERSWQIEMAIPWADMIGSAPAAGDEIGFNVGRVHRPRQPTEWTTWAPLQQGNTRFAQTEGFGRLRLAQRAPAGVVPERVSGLVLPDGLLRNPAMQPRETGEITDWLPGEGTTYRELVSMSRYHVLRNESGDVVASQPLGIDVQAGQIISVTAAIRGGDGAAAGVALVQEMADGTTRDLHPFARLTPGEDFGVYTAQAMVETGARGLREVRLERSGDAGWVEFAFAQLMTGAHGAGGIFDANRCTGPDERGVGEPWQTPALASLKPLEGGPIRALIVIGEFQRDAAELAQRLDLDYDLVYSPTGRRSQVEQVVAFDAGEILERLAAHEYELIVLAGKPSEMSTVSLIINSVAAGTGVVVVEPIDPKPAIHQEQYDHMMASLAADDLPTDRVHELLGALDPGAITATSRGTEMLRSVGAGELEQGRIARVSWANTVPGLVPFASGSGEYWEYRWSALAQACAWAARRLPETAISSLDAGDHLSVSVTAPDNRTLRLETEWDTPFGVIEGGTVEIAPTGGAAEHAVAIPAVLARTRGPIIARALLSDAEGNALGMAATPLAETQPRIEVTGISAPEVARPGEQIAVQVRYRADAPASLAVELIDAFGRVVSREEIAGAAGDEAEANVSLMVRDPLSVYHRVAVTALDGEAVADRRERDVFVPEASADHLDRFMLGVGYAVMQIRCPEYLQDHLVAFMRAHGVETATVNEYMVRRGMPSFGGTLRAPMAHRSGGNERDPSFSDPEKVAALAEHTVNAVAEKHRWGFYGFNMTDEVHLHQRATVETDTGEHALRNWRAWSEELYGTIEAANASWGTDYASFDAANIPLIADMRGETNPARWVDFRVFMEREWAGAYAAAYRAVKEQYPDVNMSFTNPYKYNSLSGTDFSLWIPNEDVLLRYIPRHSLDRNTSWSDAPILSWFGYRSNHRAVGHTVWNFALAGGVVPFWWNPIEPWAYAGEEGFRPWNMFGPLWRETGRSQAVTRSTEQLQSGIGRLLRAARQEQPEAAILHSQPSMHVLYWEVAVEHGGPTDAGWNRYIASDDAMAAALKRQGMGYTYLLPDQLNAETLAGIRLLALPSCVALSDDAAAALAEYVRSGGRILADTLPATHDEHGSPREAGSPLAPLFGATGARMLGDYADGDSTEALDSAIADLEVQASRTWRKADGGLPEYTRAYRYQLGDGHYLGIVRDPTDRAYADGEVTVELGGDYFVYDSVARRSLGRMSSLTFNLRAGAARFFSLLPYQPRQVRLTAQFEGDDLVIEAGVDAEAMTDHLLHVTVVPPGAEQPAQHYTRTILAEGGRVQTRIPMALNDPAGLWMVGVRDVATGLGDARAVGRR